MICPLWTIFAIKRRSNACKQLTILKRLTAESTYCIFHAFLPNRMLLTQLRC